MGYLGMGKFLLVLYVMANVVESVRIDKSLCELADHYRIFIHDRLVQDPAPLKLHCTSRTRDIGLKIIKYRQYYSWHICNFHDDPQPFYCHFAWGSKEVLFDAIDLTLAHRCILNTCNWFARDDGVYFGKHKLGARGVWAEQSSEAADQLRQNNAQPRDEVQRKFQLTVCRVGEENSSETSWGKKTAQRSVETNQLGRTKQFEHKLCEIGLIKFKLICLSCLHQVARSSCSLWAVGSGCSGVAVIKFF
ncbi:hypothetical protein F511_18528 [Dorcoceras hygrometricum]|uniref:S-protein homolog n=1 Tax=Dorcoceras hygrometricum TaxID=472368 RepID=A0A2Z7B5W1_9LAMI|nr:hypothetical protein F511_18528 [Dorcoceras hygrometricum]